MNPFSLNRWLPALLGGALLFFAHRTFGWPGVAAAGGGLVMWLLLHFTRLMTVMKRAARQPIGWVASAVMLNAKLRQGQALMHVVAMTRSLGERLSDDGEQPERYRWTDNGASSVDVTITNGKVSSWSLTRPGDGA